MRNAVKDKICDVCGRSFARNEHLLRHHRTHTSERPYPCPLCDMTFARSDVLDTHVQRHHGLGLHDATVITSTRISKRTSLLGSGRSSLACDECRRRKLRCDNKHPCEQCVNRSHQCTVSSTSKPPGRPYHQIGPASQTKMAGPSPNQEAPRHYGMCMTPASLDRTESLSDATLALEHNAEAEIQVAVPSVVPGVLTANIDNEHIDPLFGLDLSYDIGNYDQGWENLETMNILWQPSETEIQGWHEDMDDCSLIWNNNSRPALEHAQALLNEHFHYRSLVTTSASLFATQSTARPSVDLYDRETVNVFMNLAKRNLASTFAIFHEFDASSNASQCFWMAFAAYGGLLCQVNGSLKIAQALYNDARRLLLENVLTDNHIDPETASHRVKTFMLLELYGLASGDKRACEFAEVFHATYLRELQKHIETRDFDHGDRVGDLEALLAAANIIECYRALIFQLPPTIALVSRDRLTRNFTNESSVVALFDPSVATKSHGIEALALISSCAYMVGPHGQDGCGAGSLWNGDFVGTSLHRWLQSYNGLVPLSETALYCLTHIAMHTNLALLQQVLTVSKTGTTAPSAPDATKHALKAWLDSEHLPVATWYAKHMMKCFEDSRKTAAKIKRGCSAGPLSLPQSPHMPYCIYYAGLVLWAEARNTRKDSAAILERVMVCLHILRTPVAETLAQAFTEDDTEE